MLYLCNPLFLIIFEQAAKICNNMLLAIGMIGTAETMNLGIRYSWAILGVFFEGERLKYDSENAIDHSYSACAFRFDFWPGYFIITFYLYVCRNC